MWQEVDQFKGAEYFRKALRLCENDSPKVKRNTWGTTKYMELYIVADSKLFKRQERNYEKTKARIMEIANYVDKFYKALNIRVPLIGLEVWTERDQCIISEEPNATLWSFLQWRQKLKSRKKHDNAQLLT
ncbi:hypothetical protein AMECASPLE_024087 [Ameca splendens]|uniref:Peptidase M12B domain-containing protein n=1 Tax=Ameca splendens TaxID=208324 RepID=A0ABV0XHD2_9TELE